MKKIEQHAKGLIVQISFSALLGAALLLSLCGLSGASFYVALGCAALLLLCVLQITAEFSQGVQGDPSDRARFVVVSTSERHERGTKLSELHRRARAKACLQLRWPVGWCAVICWAAAGLAPLL
ncbi:hypothetical protein [Polycladidibacter hongkongensis]|uniref:hypothetical protein n=1 Tax=Polycladidibacter hongkongensis TaxID=1647556 RepID=UPI000833002B|nr:hypothetical protein [Pseudovibrio hongkongensis]